MALRGGTIMVIENGQKLPFDIKDYGLLNTAILLIVARTLT